MTPTMVSIIYLWDLINYDSNTQQIVKWIGNALMYSSAIAISVSISISVLPVTYLGFLFAHIIWAFFAWKMKDKPLLYQFLFFIPLDIYAFFIRL